MDQSFKAYQITKDDNGQHVQLKELTENDLPESEVLVRIEYSTVNYKDGLAMTGTVPVVRKFPMIPGVDFSGVVVESTNADFIPGDNVILNGFGVGEIHCGGFSEFANVKSDWLIHRPEKITSRQAMAVGTAGYTAMLCVMALEQHGIRPEDGRIVVTGAAGGVGSVAVMILHKLGFNVVAVTGRISESIFLTDLGATEIIERDLFSKKAAPLAKEEWAGAIDVAGGNTLANVISQIKYGGAVAACGLADSMELATSVAPFILRGVHLIGIDSVMAPMQKRKLAWQRIADELDVVKLEGLSREIGLKDIPDIAEKILKGEVRGRTIVKIK